MLAPLLLLWPMSLALTWLAAQGIASLPYDRALIESVRSLGQRVEVRGDDILFDLSRETARMLRADEVDNVYYLVRGSRGEIVSGDRDLPLPPADEPRTPGQVKVRSRREKTASMVRSCQVRSSRAVFGRSACSKREAMAAKSRSFFISGIPHWARSLERSLRRCKRRYSR